MSRQWRSRRGLDRAHRWPLFGAELLQYPNNLAANGLSRRPFHVDVYAEITNSIRQCSIGSPRVAFEEMNIELDASLRVIHVFGRPPWSRFWHFSSHHAVVISDRIEFGIAGSSWSETVLYFVLSEVPIGEEVFQVGELALQCFDSSCDFSYVDFNGFGRC